MTRPKLESVSKAVPEVAGDQLGAMRALFPEAFAEGKIDFTKLRGTLGDIVDDRPERYTFTWAGKRDAIRLLQTPSRATLVPVPKESVNFEQTGNVFIEGDNLEVLKLLYKAYFGQVKMIYIDPPYNTGQDFIYPDNFADPLDFYLKLTGQKDAEGNLLTSNPDTSGRYHSSWLSMMYPRLFLARQLLREDGVIFVSIDDHEAPNLRMLMNEVFGEENFIAQLVWKSRQFPDSRAVTQVSTDHEYIVVYARRSDASLRGIERDESKFSNPDSDSRGPWMSRSLLGLATAEQRPNLHYKIVDPDTRNTYSPPPNTGWRYSEDRMKALITDKKILFPSSPEGRPREKKFRSDLLSEFVSFPSIIDNVFTANGTAEIRETFGFEAFDFPKPSELIRRLVEQSTSQDDIVFDPFAGSATTAHAVLAQNRKDGGRRRFVCIQLPEPIGTKLEAAKRGFSSVSEIGKERIRRVISAMKQETKGKLDLQNRDSPEDLGFKVFKLCESNYRPWPAVGGTEGTKPDAATYADQMQMFTHLLVEGWKPEPVIWEVTIKEGFGLNSRIERDRIVNGNTVWRVTDPDKGQSFRICLDDEVNVSTLTKLELARDDLFVCLDAALDDEAAANLALQCRLKTI